MNMIFQLMSCNLFGSSLRYCSVLSSPFRCWFWNLFLSSFHCSLPVPFYGDRLSLRSDPRWSKLAAEYNETRVVWADNIIKVNRHDGKVSTPRVPSPAFLLPLASSLSLLPCNPQAVPHVMVVGVRSMYVLDPKSFTVKSRVSLSDLDHVSVSAHSDGNCIFHITQVREGLV